MLVSQPTNVLYLSGYRGSAGWLLVTAGRQFIITDFRYHELVRREVDEAYELVDCTGKRLSEILPELLETCGARRLGVEFDAVSHHSWLRLAAMPGVEVVDAAGLVDGLRAVKEPGES